MSTNNDPAEARALTEEPDISLAATKVFLAMYELGGTALENLLAVRTGFSATEVRAMMQELADAIMITQEPPSTPGDSFDALPAGL
jgi:hypothetical protein